MVNSEQPIAVVSENALFNSRHILNTFPVHFFQVVITKLKIDRDRKKILERKDAGRRAADEKLKGKHTEDAVAATAE